jgi:hypothetical protein
VITGEHVTDCSGVGIELSGRNKHVDAVTGVFSEVRVPLTNTPVAVITGFPSTWYLA